jgi:transcriptional regulator with XRE-family HTH domain
MYKLCIKYTYSVVKNQGVKTMSGIKQLRIQKGLTQSELGKRAGIGQHRVSLIERGLNPRKGELDKLRKALLQDESRNSK